MKRLSIVLTVGLAGCIPSSLVQKAVEPIAQLNDDTRLAAETVLCRGISIGAWMRAYGSDPEKSAGWRALCQEQIRNMPGGTKP